MASNFDRCAQYLVLLYSCLSLSLAQDATILIITKDDSCNSTINLTSYTETSGSPMPRCGKSQTGSSLFEDILEDEECVEEIEDVLDFCQAAFVEEGNVTHCLRTQRVTESQLNTLSDPSLVYSNGSVCEPFRTIQKEYLNFEAILDRTLVGVYAETCKSKTVCLNAYTRWLCSITLNWFQPIESDSTHCTNDTLYGIDNVTYTRVLPCVGVCHDVLRRCPYYLPSEQQVDNDPAVLIYGGYPAFDCPMENSLCCNCNNSNRTSSYPPPDFACFGNSSFSLVATESTVMIMLLFTLLWQLV